MVSIGNPSDDRLVSRRDAAFMLGLEVQTLARWGMTNKYLPVIKIGRTVRYRRQDVQRLIAEGSTTDQAA